MKESVFKMEKDLFLRIKQQMTKMSKGHKLIANYILSHYDKAAFMTAQKLERLWESANRRL